MPLNSAPQLPISESEPRDDNVELDSDRHNAWLFGTYSSRTNIPAIGSGTAKPLPILTQYTLAFTADEKLKSL